MSSKHHSGFFLLSYATRQLHLPKMKACYLLIACLSSSNLKTLNIMAISRSLECLSSVWGVGEVATVWDKTGSSPVTTGSVDNATGLSAKLETNTFVMLKEGSWQRRWHNLVFDIFREVYCTSSDVDQVVNSTLPIQSKKKSSSLFLWLILTWIMPTLKLNLINVRHSSMQQIFKQALHLFVLKWMQVTIGKAWISFGSK